MLPWIQRTLVVVPTLLAASIAAPARAQSDTSTSGRSLFTYRDGLLAVAVTAGALLVRPLDEQYAVRLQDSSTQANRRLHVLSRLVRTTTAPGSYIIGSTMYLAGRVTKEQHLTELGLRGTEALLVGEAVGGVMKVVFGRQRPDVEPRNANGFGFMRGLMGGDPYHSFPSGHTLAAFAAAAAVTSETSKWWPSTQFIIGPIMFGGATITGMSRMYDNRHWASDVIVGAGLGTFAGLKVVRYHNAHPGTRIDRLLLSGSIVPTATGGHAFHWSLLPGVSLGGPRR